MIVSVILLCVFISFCLVSTRRDLRKEKGFRRLSGEEKICDLIPLLRKAHST